MDPDDEQGTEEIADPDQESVPDHTKRRVPEGRLQRKDIHKHNKIDSRQEEEDGKADRAERVRETEAVQNEPVRRQRRSGSRHDQADHGSAAQILLKRFDKISRNMDVFIPRHRHRDPVERTSGGSQCHDGKREANPEKIQKKRVRHVAEKPHHTAVRLKKPIHPPYLREREQ